MNHLAVVGETMSMLVRNSIPGSCCMKCHLKVNPISGRNHLKPEIIFVVWSMNSLFDITYSCLDWRCQLCAEKMTFVLIACSVCVYLAKAAFAQHHEEVEVVDAHSDFSRTWGVDRRTGWYRSRGQGHRERFRQRGGYRLRQRGCWDVWLRLLVNRSGRMERWMAGCSPTHTYTHTQPEHHAKQTLSYPWLWITVRQNNPAPWWRRSVTGKGGDCV